MAVVTDETLTVSWAWGAPDDWDESVRRGECLTLLLYHTTHWARRQRRLLGYRPVYFSIDSPGGPVLRLLGFACVPWRAVGIGAAAREAVHCGRRRALGTLRWYGLPVATAPADTAAYAALANVVQSFAAKRWLAPSGGNWPLEVAEAATALWPCHPWATLIVPLGPSLEAMEANLRRSARKAIRRARRDGLTVRRVQTIDQLRDYYSFAEECSRRYRKRMYGFRDFESMWCDIRPHGVFETFVAEKDDQMIAGLSIWGFGSSVGELGSFQSERSFQEKLFGPDLVKWEALRWGHAAGLTRFDLAGVNPDPATDKEAQIRQFKEKWGGEYVEYLAVS